MRKRVVLQCSVIALAALIPLAGCATVPGGEWTTRAQMPTGRWELATCVVDGKIYAIGGGSGTSTSFNNVETFSAVEMYDPETDTWTTRADMPTSRGYHCANVVDGRIYVFGGSQNSSPDGTLVPSVEVYDPATDTWSQVGEMPAPRGAGFSSAVDGKIYVFGGYGGSDAVHEYDPAKDTWTERTPMPMWRNAHCTSALDGRILVIGGYGGTTGYRYQGLTTVDVYDPASDTWTTAPDLPSGRFGPRSCVVDGRMYVIGGMSHWIDTALGVMEVYEGTSERSR